MSDSIQMDDVEKVLRGIKIPPQPQIMVDIEMEMAMPDFDLAAIGKLVARDVGLSGTVLKTVNSSFFGLRNKISSVQQAIGLLGVNSLVAIINAISIRGALSNEQIIALNDFWDLSEEVAAASALIAKKVLSQAPEEAYTLGLFHNAAIPLMMQRFEGYVDQQQRGYQDPEGRITRVESDGLHTDHAAVGFFIARAWKLPAHICDAIAQHHDCKRVFHAPDLSESKKTNLLAVLKVAEHLCGVYRVLGQSDADHEFEQIHDALLGYLGLTDIDLANLRDDLHDQGII